MSQRARSRGRRVGISGGVVVKGMVIGAVLLLGACGGGGGGGGTATEGGTAYTPGGGTGTALLSWSAPTQREDGSAMAPGDIASYRIHFGPSSDPAHFVINVQDGTQTQYTVTGLDPETWTFALSVVDTGGQESAESNSMTKTIN